MSWSYARTSQEITPKWALEIFAECLDVVNVLSFDTAWDLKTVNLNLSRVVRFLAGELSDESIRFASNGDVQMGDLSPSRLL